MEIKNWIEKVGRVVPSDIANDDGEIWVSKFDGSYITRVGMVEDNSLIKFLAEHGVSESLQHGIGFSDKEGKWYGWSHRAIYGFSVGSECKKGDCGYRASCLEEEVEAAIRFYNDDDVTDIAGKKSTDENGNPCIEITWVYSDDMPNKALAGKSGCSRWHYDPDNFGRGEWTAKTLEDAKQMAVDFNEGVS